MASTDNARAAAAAQVAANVTTAQIFPLASAAAIPATVTAGAGGIYEQKEFTVRATGRVTTAGAYTVVVSLYAGLVIPASPLVAGSWTLLGASTARAVGTTTCPFMIAARLRSDALSGKLHGEFTANVNNLLDGYAALSNVLTGVNLASSTVEPGVVFAVGVTFNTGNVANIGNLGDFVIGF